MTPITNVSDFNDQINGLLQPQLAKNLQFKLIKKPRALDMACISKSTLHLKMIDGVFPPSISLGERAVAFVEHEVLAVIAAQIQGKSKDEIRSLVQDLVGTTPEFIKRSVCMSHLNEMDAFVLEQGVLAAPVKLDGKLRRAKTVDRPNSQEAWLVAYPNHLTIGNWRTGMKCTWRPQGVTPTNQDKEELRLARIAYKAEIVKKQLEAIVHCQDIWQSTEPVTNHPYLIKKQIKAYTARLHHNNTLAVPICSLNGELMSLQFISSDGQKRFKRGASLKGNASLIGDFDNPHTLLVCEGYATGCSLHEATRLPVVVAFNANNLAVVSQSLSIENPNIKLVICADNDHQNQRKTGVNVGLEKARIVAEQLNVLRLWPEFYPDNDGSDFNDIHCQQGLGALTNMLMPAINGGL